MAHIAWSSNLSVGIDVIDRQHMRIVNYINELDDAINSTGPDRASRIMSTLNDAIDYTESHFGFEEAMLEDAGYPFLKAHKKVHELFVRKIADYRSRLELGDDIAVELRETLTRWLLNHIRSEDADYGRWIKVPADPNAAPAATAAASAQPNKRDVAQDQGWLGSRLKRFFGG